MAPKKRKKINEGLPTRWHRRYGSYYYFVRDAERAYFDNKKEFRLGKTLAEAHKVFAARIAKLSSADGVTEMDDLCDMYMIKAVPLKSPRSAMDLPRYVKTIRAVFGSSVIEAIESKHCYQFYETLKESKGHNTANKHMETLSDMLSNAIRWGLLQDHPMTGGKFKKTRPKTKPRYIEDWEIIEALSVAPPLIKAYVELKWLTGLRQTDLLFLKWSDVRKDGIHVTPSKTSSTTRKSMIFPLNDDLLDALALVKSVTPRVGSLYLFASRTGQSYLDKNKKCNGFQSIWGRWMRKALANTKLELRFQERQIRNKVSDDSDSVEEASKRLNHSDLSTTKRFYRSKPEVVTTLRRKK